jgi:phosphate/sulfate permease
MRQGAVAEITAMCDDRSSRLDSGLPVSTTHVLSSGIAGTMYANHSGIAVGYGAQYGDGVGAHAASCDASVRFFVLAV